MSKSRDCETVLQNQSLTTGICLELSCQKFAVVNIQGEASVIMLTVAGTDVVNLGTNYQLRLMFIFVVFFLLML